MQLRTAIQRLAALLAKPHTTEAACEAADAIAVRLWKEYAEFIDGPFDLFPNVGELRRWLIWSALLINLTKKDRRN